MAEEYRALYQSHAVAPYHVACAYREAEERFYVVARLNNRVVAYNDIEDIFGVGTSMESGPVTDWADYGPLVLALRVLVQQHP